MQTIYILGAGMSLFLFFLSLKNKSNISEKLFSVLLLAFSLHLVFFYLSQITRDTYGFFYLRSSMALLYGPLLYLYIDYQSKSVDRFLRCHWWHFVPFVVFTIILLAFSISNLVNNAILNSIENTKAYTIGKITIISSAAIYFVFCFISLKRYKKNLLQRYSYTEKIDLKWINWLLYGLFFTWILIFTLVILNRIHMFMSIKTEHTVTYVFMCTFILITGFKGIKQSHIFTQSRVNIHLRNVQPPPKNTNDDLTLYFNRIRKLVEEEKLFLNPKLTINDISSRLDLNINYISKAINTVGNCNFFEFINRYRVNEFKTQVMNTENSNYTLLAIATQCGFNSKASFNRIFKNITGLTPAEFKNQHLLS
jgi:AraC-like DNA-binding protein